MTISWLFRQTLWFVSVFFFNDCHLWCMCFVYVMSASVGLCLQVNHRSWMCELSSWRNIHHDLCFVFVTKLIWAKTTTSNTSKNPSSVDQLKWLKASWNWAKLFIAYHDLVLSVEISLITSSTGLALWAQMIGIHLFIERADGNVWCILYMMASWFTQCNRFVGEKSFPVSKLLKQ